MLLRNVRRETPNGARLQRRCALRPRCGGTSIELVLKMASAINIPMHSGCLARARGAGDQLQSFRGRTEELLLACSTHTVIVRKSNDL
jgi:hypothetical protein